MKAFWDLFSQPLHFSLLVGVMIGTLTYTAGRWAVQPLEQMGEQELTLLAHEVAHAFLVSIPENQFLQPAMAQAVLHPRVLSVMVRSPKNEVLHVTYKNKGSPSYKSSELSLPLVDGENKSLATIVLELTGQPNSASAPLRRRVNLFAVLGFLIGFGVCHFMFERKEPFLLHFVTTIKNVAAGQLDVALPVPRDEKFSELSLAFNHMMEGLKERDRMRHSLGRIMDPKIAEILIKEDPKLGGLRRQATILFCDIRNYTALCEQLDSDELQMFLNEYWKGTVDIIMEQEGTIDKFHGDGVCVVFGAPALHPDDPLRAVRTSWRLIQNVDQLNKRRQAERKMPIQIGIGIHCGEVIAGHIGSERRMDYTVVGDAVNVAARIEELNKKFGTKILISDNVYEKVESFVHVKTLALAHLRGHQRPILVHTVREFFDASEENEQQKAA